MLPGISGALLAPTFLERAISRELGAIASDRDLRRLQRWWRRAERTLGPATSARVLLDTGALPFFADRGYRIVRVEPHAAGFAGLLRRDGTPVALSVAAWNRDPDQEWRAAVRAGYTGGARWGFIYTGQKLRVVDATRSWSRRALEFDLSRALGDQRSATALITIVEAAGKSGDAALSLGDLIERSDAYGVDVCSSLGLGVLDALESMVSELGSARCRPHGTDRAVFEQAVTLIYRLLFMLFAEARAVVPIWHQIYREGYSIDALCRRSLMQPSRRGLWKALQATARMAYRGCHAGDLTVTAFNGRLFSPHHTPLAERATLSDAAVRRAIVSLATRTGRGARERIAYGDLGVEQLGAVYERVLEYEPAREAGRLRLTRTSHDRKATGTFYTPRAVTEFLVRRVLHPLVEGKTADEILRLRVLDPAMGSGAFLVAACRFLASAVQRALIDAGPTASTRDSNDLAAIRRLVAQRCLYGVDLNPMAVQLARLSLWLATLARDRPLSFLDHHLAVGDSLIGASLHDLLRSPTRTGRRWRTSALLPLFESVTAHSLSTTILPERFRIACDPDDTVGDVHAKERVLTELTASGTPLAGWKEAADVWCAASYWGSPPLGSGVYHDVLAALTGAQAMLADDQRLAVVERARQLAARHRFFHWDLAFPEAFFDSNGRRNPDAGFDAVIGNPPWEVLRADAGDRGQRSETRSGHRDDLRFFRDSQIYRHQGDGHTNRYQLFVERALQLTRRGGRLALIVPSGLATDRGSSLLRRELLAASTVERLMGFDNRRGIFPIHRDTRFLLVTTTKGGATTRVPCAFGRSDVEWLDRLPDAAVDDPVEARPVVIPAATLSAWDPEHCAVPWLADPKDFDILSAVSQTTPVLDQTEGWHVRFGRELNATEDRPHFVERRANRAAALVVVGGKHLEPFRVRLERSDVAIDARTAATLVEASRTFQRARLAYRDVASATNRLTLIAARLPAGAISTHTIFCSKDTLGADAQYCLLALLNSLVANYLIRLRVTTHVTTAMMARLPVPRPAGHSAEFRELAALSRKLETTGVAGHDDDYVRVNAIAARLYGLSASQYQHVVSTFPLLPEELRARCVAAYREASGQARAGGPLA